MSWPIRLHPRGAAAAAVAVDGPVVRLQIGLEDPEDLIEDLAQALSGYGA